MIGNSDNALFLRNIVKQIRESDKMQTMIQQNYQGERALFIAHDLEIKDSIFENGESPLKESRDIKLDNCVFKWKYPLWYSHNIM